MKSISLIISLLLTFSSFAQIEWKTDFKLAKALALQENKFIVMDFWAVQENG